LAARAGKWLAMRPAKRSDRSTPLASRPNVPTAPCCSWRCTRRAKAPNVPLGRRTRLRSPAAPSEFVVSTGGVGRCNCSDCWVHGLKACSARSKRRASRRPISASGAGGCAAGAVARWTTGSAGLGFSGALTGANTGGTGVAASADRAGVFCVSNLAAAAAGGSGAGSALRCTWDAGLGGSTGAGGLIAGSAFAALGFEVSPAGLA